MARPLPLYPFPLMEVTIDDLDARFRCLVQVRAINGRMLTSYGKKSGMKRPRYQPSFTVHRPRKPRKTDPPPIMGLSAVDGQQFEIPSSDESVVVIEHPDGEGEVNLALQALAKVAAEMVKPIDDSAEVPSVDADVPTEGPLKVRPL